VDGLDRVLSEAPDFAEPGTVEEVLAAEAWARSRAGEIVETTSGQRKERG